VEVLTNKTRDMAILLGLEPDSNPSATPDQNVCASSIVGLPGYPVRDVRLENIEIIYPGGGVAKKHSIAPGKLDSVPELPAQYPEFWMFGELPACGFYVRHADGIAFSNVCLRLKQSDFRPALVCDDVSRMSADQLTVSAAPHDRVMLLQNVRDASFKRSNFPAAWPGGISLQGDCQKVEGLQ